MVDVYCCNCQEPWEVLGLLDDDGLTEAHKDHDFSKGSVVKFGFDEEFVADFYISNTEIEHFLLLKCACCKVPPKCPVCKGYLELSDYNEAKNCYKCSNCKHIVELDNTIYNPKRCESCGEAIPYYKDTCEFCG